MKFTILTFLALSFLFISCENEDQKKSFEEKITFEEKIMGDWGISSFVINCDDASFNEPMTFADESGCVNMFGEPSCIYISFMAEGKGELRNESPGYNSEVNLMSYDLDKENQTVSICDESYGDCTIFTLKDDRLLYDEDEDSCICTFAFAK